MFLILFFIYGDSGLGKTPPLKAIAYEIANNKTRNECYIHNW